MTCNSCGAELPSDAKFCAQCGAPVEAETQVLDPEPEPEPEPIDEELPPTQVVEPVPAEPAPDNTTTGVTSPALQRVIETPPRPARPPRERRPLEERGTFEEFVGAVMPLLRAPRFAGNLLAALVAFTYSLAIAAVAWLLLDRVLETTLGLLPLVNLDDDELGAITLLGLTFHQVPFVRGDLVQSTAPLLLAAIPIIGCALGLVVGRRTVPASGDVDGFIARVAPFAAIYGVLCFAWSLIGVDDWHAAHLSSLLAGFFLALLGAALAERRLRPTVAEFDDELEASRARTRTRPARALRTGARVLALLVAIGSIGWLIGTTVAVFQAIDEGRGEAWAESALHVIEGGFEALGFGVLAEGTVFGTVDEDEGMRVWELTSVLPDGVVAIYVIVAFALVLVGGLFSGFAMARAAEPRSRNDHAMYGALTGVVWAVALLVAQQVVFMWLLDGDDRTSTFDGVQTVCFSLLVGGALGALGGLLAAGPRALPVAVEQAADAVRDDADPGTTPV